MNRQMEQNKTTTATPDKFVLGVIVANRYGVLMAGVEPFRETRIQH